MLSFTPYKGACTGCSACMSVCPVDCISMQVDDEGFWYPISSESCINCGKCEKVCPVLKHGKTVLEYKQKSYACASRNIETWRRSASGGAFSEICYAWGDDKTIVVGAAWDGFDVHHICVEGVENIAPLCKSKYVASNPENTFREIKEYLKKGRNVIFCGTPCQVAGLKASLVKYYENLLTIDLICHGVGSRDVFKTAIHVIEEQLNCKAFKYEFRAKRKYYEQDYISSIDSNSGIIYLDNDPYMQLFLNQDCLRPSCGRNCVFRDSNRQGDFTLADLKGMRLVFPDLVGSRKNYTAVVVNSKRAEKTMEKIAANAEVREFSIDFIKKYNPLFYRQTYFSKNRDSFFLDYIKSKEGAIIKWTKRTKVYKPSIKRLVITFLPSSILRILYSLYIRLIKS